ncbi:unnamed protein product [Microthlaspi erraticum]|uniref:Uncharacterized protein n=1 Tax=Microthlaspi erraticum TaxID=1685480 RepID=A0A6D2JBC5_9BRAS|nr:unnamed protein product [Microthlaspi erraticum]
MGDQIQAMQDKLSCTSTSGGVRRSTAPVDPQPIDLSDEELDPVPTGSRQHTTDQPRYSSYEPRERKRRKHEHQTPGQSETRADADTPVPAIFLCTTPGHPRRLSSDAVEHCC